MAKKSEYGILTGRKPPLVSCCDLMGVEHAIEMTANSLYEAVAQGLRAFRENDWVEDIGRRQQTTITVVSQLAVRPEVGATDQSEATTS
jgi:hypothetical protein